MNGHGTWHIIFESTAMVFAKSTAMVFIKISPCMSKLRLAKVDVFLSRHDTVYSVHPMYSCLHSSPLPRTLSRLCRQRVRTGYKSKVHEY